MKKKTPPPSPGQWSDLATVGDIKRFLRWCIIGCATDKIEVRKASALSQMGNTLLRAVEVEAITAQVDALERRLDDAEQDQGPTPLHESHSSFTTH